MIVTDDKVDSRPIRQGFWRHVSPWYAGALVLCLVVGITLRILLGAYPVVLIPFLWFIFLREHFLLSRRSASTDEEADLRDAPPKFVPFGQPKEEALFALSMSFFSVGIGLLAAAVITADEMAVSDTGPVIFWACGSALLGALGIALGRVFTHRREIADTIESWSEH